jgi:hypothetical protein
MQEPATLRRTRTATLHHHHHRGAMQPLNRAAILRTAAVDTIPNRRLKLATMAHLPPTRNTRHLNR